MSSMVKGKQKPSKKNQKSDNDLLFDMITNIDKSSLLVQSKLGMPDSKRDMKKPKTVKVSNNQTIKHSDQAQPTSNTIDIVSKQISNTKQSNVVKSNDASPKFNESVTKEIQDRQQIAHNLASEKLNKLEIVSKPGTVSKDTKANSQDVPKSSKANNHKGRENIMSFGPLIKGDSKQ